MIEHARLSTAVNILTPSFFYSFAGKKVEIRNHYRGHKLSMWLSLIPQLHAPGDSAEMSMRHHHFTEENAQYYDGKWYTIEHNLVVAMQTLESILINLSTEFNYIVRTINNQLFVRNQFAIQ
jgi:hypothetical protein